jgi:hypothetical protein
MKKQRSMRRAMRGIEREAKVLTGGLGGEHGGVFVPRRAPAPLRRRSAAHGSIRLASGG